MVDLPEIKGFLETTLLDWPGKVASVIFLPCCNFRCPFCHNHQIVTEPGTVETLPFSIVRERLLGLKRWNDGVVVSGGEPTVSPGLHDLIEYLRNDGFAIKLDTNGSRPGVLAKLLRQDLLDAVSMDVKAPLNDTAYRRNAGVAVDLEKIRASMKLLARAADMGLQVEFRTTFTPGLLDDEDIQEIERTVRLVAPKARYKVQAFNPENPLDPALKQVNPPHIENKIALPERPAFLEP